MSGDRIQSSPQAGSPASFGAVRLCISEAVILGVILGFAKLGEQAACRAIKPPQIIPLSNTHNNHEPEK